MEGERTDESSIRVNDRAQSAFDYTIGVSVFVIVILAVFAFVPTAFGSFGGEADDAASDGLAADRGVDHLTRTILGSSGPNVGLDTGCAILFFSASSTHPDVEVTEADCELDGPRSDTLPGRLSLSPTTGANVTVEAEFGSGRKIACWDTTSGAVVEATSSDCGDDADDVRFGAGPAAARNPGYATANRAGTIDGADVTVAVRVW